MFDFLKKKKEPEVATTPEVYRSFGTGKVVELSEVPDQVFAQKMMGDGFAIELTDGKVVAPASGEIILVFPTGHAFGLKTADGVEILLHLGIDTVELNGEGFASKVKQGDHVKQGDILTEMDLESIKNNGKSVVSPMIFTSGQEINLLKANQEVTTESEGIFEFK